ncbi:unnamed protein product [Bursaphelenchus xylophilus]|uniref:(pine wood nematode) hypothetical protein n=1 Tax=Bursaphelenchus xylophilus TaxID=6326 RepID=A0A1I7RVV5_BURXY|nr:unnamed protein product [Bursaphelenchus xylophilus]CAG9094751.1 unnamed protein product [Bursaphelenchus xylophilus]
MELRAIYPEICFIVTAISLSLSSLVIFLSYRVLKGSGQREYSWIMAFNAGVDFFYSLTHGIVMPSEVVGTASTAYFAVENPYLQHIPSFAVRNAGFFLLVVDLSSAPCSAVHFYYRYRLLCKGDLWSKRRYVGTYGMALAAIFFTVLLFCASLNLANERSREELLVVAGYLVCPPHVYVTLGDPIFILCMCICQLMFVAEYSIIVFCGQRIIRHAQQGTSAAISTRKAQKHLITVMILQAAYPLILYFLPFICVTAMLSTGVKFQSASYIAGLSLQLLSPLNSISVLTLMPAYRRALTGKSANTSGSRFAFSSVAG